MIHEVGDGQAARHDKGGLKRHGHTPSTPAVQETCESDDTHHGSGMSVRRRGVTQKREAFFVRERVRGRPTANKKEKKKKVCHV